MANVLSIKTSPCKIDPEPLQTNYAIFPFTVTRLIFLFELMYPEDVTCIAKPTIVTRSLFSTM